jgi:hypothetical protein
VRRDMNDVHRRRYAWHRTRDFKGAKSAIRHKRVSRWVPSHFEIDVTTVPHSDRHLFSSDMSDHLLQTKIRRKRH